MSNDTHQETHGDQSPNISTESGDVSVEFDNSTTTTIINQIPKSVIYGFGIVLAAIFVGVMLNFLKPVPSSLAATEEQVAIEESRIREKTDDKAKIEVKLKVFSEKIEQLQNHLKLRANDDAPECDDAPKCENAAQLALNALKTVNLVKAAEELSKSFSNTSADYNALDKAAAEAFDLGSIYFLLYNAHGDGKYLKVAHDMYNESIKLQKKFEKRQPEKLKEEKSEENKLTMSMYLTELGSVELLSRKFVSANEHFTDALNLRISALGEEHLVFTDIDSNFGKPFCKNEVFADALDPGISALGKEYLDVASSYNNLGKALYQNFDHCGAIKKYKKALAISEAFLESDPETFSISNGTIDVKNLKALANRIAAASSNNLGNTLAEIKDPEAKTYYKKALKIYRGIYGVENEKQTLEVANTHHNLGILWHNSIEYDTAIIHYEKGHDIRASILGKNHPSVASSKNSLANSYVEQSEDKKAMDLLSESLCIYKDNFGDSDSRTKAVSKNRMRAASELGIETETLDCNKFKGETQ